MKAPIRPALALVAALMATPILVQAQAGPPPGPSGRGGPLGPSQDLLDLAIQNADSLALSGDQRASLEDFQTQSMERSASARELVDAERARLEAERAQADSAAGGGPGARRGRRAPGPRPEVTPELRDAMQTLAQERRAAMDELRSTLTVNQMDQLQRLARPGRAARAEARPGVRARFRGRFGFGAGVRSRARAFGGPRRLGPGGARGGRFFPGRAPGRFGPGGGPPQPRGPAALRAPGRVGDLAGGGFAGGSNFAPGRPSRPGRPGGPPR